MERYRTTWPLDDGSTSDGDAQFTGVNEYLDPQALEPGIVAGATNMRFRDRMAASRPGIVRRSWFSALAAGQLQGRGLFVDSEGLEWILRVGNGIVTATLEGSNTRTISVPAGALTGVTQVAFCRCLDTLVLFRGPDLPWLEMTSLDEGFVVNGYEVEANSGATLMPGAEWGIWWNNRLIIPYGRDQILVSDALNIHQYGAEGSTFSIGQGADDNLVSILPLSDASLLIAKEKSVYLLSNLVVNANGNFLDAQLDDVTKSWGIVSRRSLVQLGTESNALGLSKRGVELIRQAEVIARRYAYSNTQDQGLAERPPASLPLDATVRRINGQAASAAVGAYWNGRYYLAVNLDGTRIAQGNNAVLVYDVYTGQWQGTDEVLVDTVPVEWADFWVGKYQGKERLYALDSTGMIWLYEEGWEDVGATVLAMQCDVVTRAYGGSSIDTKRFQGAQWGLETWNPCFTITAENEQGHVSSLRTAVTRDRTHWDFWGKLPYVTTNANGDATDPGRQDYSVVLPTSGMTLGSGVVMDRIKPDPEKQRLPLAGRGVQMTFSNSQGRMNLQGCVVYWLPATRRYGAQP